MAPLRIRMPVATSASALVDTLWIAPLLTTPAAAAPAPNSTAVLSAVLAEEAMEPSLRRPPATATAWPVPPICRAVASTPL
ncbi:hypothetical protein D3C77_292060 [compost metagenome]